MENYTRAAALQLLEEHTKSPGLLKHALAVETCLRAYGELEATMQGLDAMQTERLVETYSITK